MSIWASCAIAPSGVCGNPVVTSAGPVRPVPAGTSMVPVFEVEASAGWGALSGTGSIGWAAISSRRAVPWA